MDSKHSRIPKFSFGLKKPNGKSSPGASPGSSPVSRSKSMKVQRTTTPLVQRRTKHSNSIDNDQDLDESQTNLLQTPMSSHMPNSQPGSRSTTPTATSLVTTGGLTRSMTVSSSRNKDTPTNIRSPQDTNGVKGHTRSSSFSSRERHNVIHTPNKRQGIHSHIPDKPRSGKGLTQSMESPRQQLKRTTSNPRTSQDESDGSADPPRHGILRNSDSRRSSIGSQNGGGRRPSSMISFSEKSSDLNELASEITQMGDPHVFGSTPPRIPSSTRALSSGSRTAQVKLNSSENSKIASKLRPPIARNTSDEGNRPSSASTNYHRTEGRSVCRPRSAADMHKINSTNVVQQQPSVVNNSHRSSTPSSGRTTPQLNIQKSIAEEDNTSVSSRIKGVPLTTPRRPSGAQTRIGRTPFFRSARSTTMGYSKTSNSSLEDAVGLNELEGAVLLDAEDYRRMLQEVKTLKSVLLRLKRELASDGGVAVSPSSMKSNARIDNSADVNSELTKQIEKLTAERNKATNELEKSQKNHEMVVTKVEQLQDDLKESKKENEDTKEKMHFLESHRESLLDKVERLHADKHKLEDRLNSLEKSVMYESTVLNEDWMADGDVYDDSIDNGYNYEDEDLTY